MRIAPGYVRFRDRYVRIARVYVRFWDQYVRIDQLYVRLQYQFVRIQLSGIIKDINSHIKIVRVVFLNLYSEDFKT